MNLSLFLPEILSDIFVLLFSSPDYHKIQIICMICRHQCYRTNAKN